MGGRGVEFGDRMEYQGESTTRGEPAASEILSAWLAGLIQLSLIMSFMVSS